MMMMMVFNFFVRPAKPLQIHAEVKSKLLIPKSRHLKNTLVILYLKCECCVCKGRQIECVSNIQLREKHDHIP